MSKFDENLEKYEAQMKEMGMEVDSALLRAITKGLGPSIYNVDSSRVACTDKSETDRVKNNFVIKKLGITDEEKAEAAVQAVCEKYDDRTRYRAVFYYLLTKDLGKESIYAE